MAKDFRSGIKTDAIQLTGGSPAAGRVLTSDSSGNATWAPPAGLSNPMTTAGDTIYGGTGGAPARLAASTTANRVLITTSANGNPSWGQVPLTAGVSGVLPIANGGTGRATATTAYGLIAAGTSATGVQQTIAPGTAGQFLKSAGAAALASFAVITTADVSGLDAALAGKASATHNHAASDVTSGVLPVARLGTGTPDGTKFLRDDGVFATPAGGGGGAMSPGVQTNSLSQALGYDNVAQQTYSAVVFPLVNTTISKLTAYCGLNNAGNSSIIEMGVYNAARTTLLGSATATLAGNTIGLVTVTLGSTITLTAGQPYYLALLNRNNEAEARFAWANNMGSSSFLANITGGTTTMPSSLSSANSTGRAYWIAGY